MKPCNRPRHLPLTLTLCALGWSTGALADRGDPAAPPLASATFESSPASTVIADQTLLELRLRGASSLQLVDLKIDGEWTPTDGDILDTVSASNMAQAVTSRFQPESGYEHRMRFRAQGSALWTAWSAWTTGRISRDTAVPAAGATNVDEFAVETRQPGGGTIAVHGYIRIKKLNSGG